MNAQQCRCGKAGSFRPGAVICDRCVSWLGRTLDQVPELLTQLDVAITRQVVVSDPLGRRSTTRLLPWNEFAARVATELDQVLGDLTAKVAADHGIDPPRGGAVTRAAWLRNLTWSVRFRSYAPDLIAELRAVTAQSWRAVDRPAGKVFAGLCRQTLGVSVQLLPGDVITFVTDTDECGAELYAEPGKFTTECPECGTVHNVEERRDALLDEAQDWFWTTTGIADCLTGFLGRSITASMIRGMAHRREIVQRGTDTATGAKLYRVGDVLEVLARRAARPKGKTA